MFGDLILIDFTKTDKMDIVSALFFASIDQTTVESVVRQGQNLLVSKRTRKHFFLIPLFDVFFTHTFASFKRASRFLYLQFN